MKQLAVYILANRRNGTLYTGVISDLVRRVWQHKHNFVPGFTQKYDVHVLVYFEVCEDMQTAICREKQIKVGSRDKKINMIESVNPEWRDLYGEIV